MKSSIDEVPEYHRLLDTYLAKTTVPSVLRPPANRGSTPPHVNLAYRHPNLLLEDDDERSVDVLSDESMIVPEKRQISGASTEKCRLVGRVNPNIVRTWEQIKSALNVGGGGSGGDDEESRTSTTSDDKQSFSLFCRKPLDFDGPEERFTVRRRRAQSQHNQSEFSGDYFDSINAAGEGLAESSDSLDPNKVKICWSTDEGE